MNKPLLSLLIPTAKGRYDQWHNLISKIFKEFLDEVDFLNHEISRPQSHISQHCH